MSAHSVFVLSSEGKPLTPTTSARARKLIKGEQAEIVWSKFGTFGIKLRHKTREAMPKTSLGCDFGTKFEGYAVVCGTENNLSVMLLLPNKRNIVRKLKERREARHTRRTRLRRRPARFNNRQRKGFIAPSQMVIVNSRKKLIREFAKIYPITDCGMEDVRFNHAKYKWGANFSTIEIGKTAMSRFINTLGMVEAKFSGSKTQSLRKKYGYKKTTDKSKEIFEAHCSDALALAAAVNSGVKVEPRLFLVIDDTYRCVRRRLHDSNIKPGGLKEPYSKGTVFGLKKGIMIGTPKGKVGQLCGANKRGFLYYNIERKRQTTTCLSWAKNQFKEKRSAA